jgi:hypothetical protein
MRNLILLLIFTLPLLAQPETTGRTLWLNASYADHLYTAYNPFSGSVSDGVTVKGWDQEDAADYGATNSTGLVWDADGLHSLGALTLPGNRIMAVSNQAGALQQIGTFITHTQFTIYAAFRASACSNNVVDSNNSAVIAANNTGGAYIVCKNNGGTVTVCGVHSDGSEDSVCLSAALATDYVAKLRHYGGSIYFSLNGGAESSTASGNTATTTSNWVIGRGLNNYYLTGYIGEILIYNVGTGTSGADTYMQRWYTAAGGPSAARRRVIQ